MYQNVVNSVPYDGVLLTQKPRLRTYTNTYSSDEFAQYSVQIKTQFSLPDKNTFIV